MSSGSFHVHGPHDHEIEHAVQHEAHQTSPTAHHGIGGRSLTSQVALFTAVAATVGALFSYMGGATQANAGLFKNNAALKKTEASNQWNYYQAKSNKQNLAELSVTLTSGEAREKFLQAIERYKKEKEDIKLDAEKLEATAKDADKKSEQEMHVHERWAMATTLLQVAIALAAITLLSRKRWMLFGVYGASALGIIAGVMGYLHL